MTRSQSLSLIALILLPQLWQLAGWWGLPTGGVELFTLAAVLAWFGLPWRRRVMVPALGAGLAQVLLPATHSAALLVVISWLVVGWLVARLKPRMEAFEPKRWGQPLFLLMILPWLVLPPIWSANGALSEPRVLVLLLASWLLGWWWARSQALYARAWVVAGLSPVVFFLLSNAGVWWEGLLYPRTLAGLVQSYAMGLPFLERQLRASMLVVPLAVTLYVWVLAPLWTRFVVNQRQASTINLR